MPHPIADQFSDNEMEQMKRYGAAQLGGTDFSAQVEKEIRKLQRKEANAAKMKAAQTSGGAGGLGPSKIETQQADQTNAISQQATSQGAQKAEQAQAKDIPLQAPAAPGPSGAGETKPFAAQAGPQPAAPAMPPPPMPPPPDQGGGNGGEDEDSDGQE